MSGVDPEGDEGIRLSHRLVALHIGAILVLIFAVLSSVLWVSREHNHLAAESSEELVRGGLSAFRLRLRTLVRDYSIWDEAYDAIESDDRPWIYSNIGNAAAEIGTLDLIEFVDTATGESFGWRAGSPPEGESGLLPPDLLATIFGLLRDGDSDEGVAKTVLAKFGGEPWAFSVARVTPVNGPPPGVAVEDLPLQIHGLRLNDARLRQIGGPLLLDNLQLADAPAPGRASIALLDHDGHVISYVTWSPPKPGARILKQVALPLLIALLTVATISGISARHAARSARRLERALHDAKAADHSKSEFLSNVSHELRTPMNGILGVAQLLETTPLDAEQRELLTMLFTSANAQMALISDLLDFSRIESGNRELVLAPFRPAEVMRDVTDMIRVAADSKGIRLDARWETIEGVDLLGDGKAFRQIVTNLVSNAVKFTEAGSVDVTAGLRPDGGRAVVFVQVTDTGRGISAEALPRIFDRFYQVDGSSTRSAEGTGLGLAISQSLAEMMGGAIHVESVLGKGSTFVFSAPFEAVAEPDGARHAA
ncbi:MAG: ATP-binding protein [Amaricoccus sp.]|uniref:sensor histidine kinase n=1 Tax=Amaricoccus sp. TaxID=1872485 RepID=UPI0039E408B4